jgi:hypothetical protein
MKTTNKIKLKILVIIASFHGLLYFRVFEYISPSIIIIGIVATAITKRSLSQTE